MSTQQLPLLPAEPPVQTASARRTDLPTSMWVFIILLLVCQALACIVGSGPSLGGKVDLRPFYASGMMIRTGHASQLYSYDFQQQAQNTFVSQRQGALPFLYPPFAALLFVPLSLLSYRHAFFALLLINLLLLAGSGLLLRPWLPAIRKSTRLFLPALYGCLFGVSIALMQGQISFLLLIILSAAWALLHTGRHVLAGLLLSLILVKFQLALPMILLFVLWRQVRVVCGFLLGALSLGLISFTMVGWAGLLSYKNSLIGVAAQGAANALAAKQRYGMFPADMPNLHGLAFCLSHGATWGQYLNLALCCVVLGFAIRQKPSLLTALPAAMLVSYHMQPHDLTLLLLPLTFLCNDMLIRRASLSPHAKHSPRLAPGLQKIDVLLLTAVPLLVLPLAALLMAKGLNYFVSIAVVATMVAASKLGHAGFTLES